MRPRTKMNGLVSHTNPSGASYQSGRNKCEQKLKRIEKLIEQGYELVGAKKKEPTHVITLVFGQECKVTIEQYNSHYKHLGFKIIAEI